MAFTNWHRLLLVVNFLLAATSAHRRDVAHNRGFHPGALRDMEARALMARNTPPNDRLYYTNSSKSESNLLANAAYQSLILDVLTLQTRVLR
jgi:hypothetical protein